MARQGDSSASETFDYIVVGAGSAGCVIANRLSADPAVRVALIEAGGEDDWHWIHIPAGSRAVIGSPRTDWCFVSEEEPMLGRRQPVPRGKVLGGSSSINGTVYTRGAATDFDHWRQLGNEGWSWDDVLPYFKRSERYVDGGDDAHGGEGELCVEHPRMGFKVYDVLTEAGQQAGLPFRKDFNRGEVEGVGLFDVTQHRGRRWSAAKAFLKPIRHRRNLKVFTRSLCQGLLLDESRVRGVDVLREGAVLRLEASREVILSAGSIGTPHILQLSGIGPGKTLQEAGITVRHERAGVGVNLMDHLTMRVATRVQGVSTLNTLYHNLFRRALMGLEYLFRSSGPMVMAAPFWGGYARSDPDRAVPNLEFLFMPLSMQPPFAEFDRFDAVSGGVYNLFPRSRGRVWATSADPHIKPSILHNYLSDWDDRRVAIDSIRLMRRIFEAPAFQALLPEEIRPGLEAQSDEDLLAASLATAGTAYHQVGTCAMGRGTTAVVNDRLRAHGLTGLRIADGSIMPALVSGSTSAAIIMVGEKAADMIRQDARQG